MQEHVLSSKRNDKKEQRLPLAVTSLVLGFLSCVMFGIISGVPAVICGHISLSKLRNDPGGYVTGKRLAIAGLFLGYAGIIMTFVLIIGFFMIYFDWGSFKILTIK